MIGILRVSEHITPFGADWLVDVVSEVEGESLPMVVQETSDIYEFESIELAPALSKKPVLA
ncbi:hypothetical protein EUZ85_02335 [Hahella sp. KA22]|uniref:hypothetical protein n=1 Tax=Hahella sp. KA22 TaxID=1628392 RepID=UPI000FDF4C75|nr:hypothetical protein [Hahella sp. KA22]AZZ95332.1 hypothetical protein ENC22_30625 [Hahella sp. KA22]QAY52977.1 hypothetical protein EUZ85_02335 [Hahella sp. KA22]